MGVTGGRRTRGNVTVLVVMLLPVLMLVLALGVDVSHAHSLGMAHKAALEDACQVLQARQEELKFSERPDELARDLVARTLAADGFLGQARVGYYEQAAPRDPGSADDDERHAVVEVVLGRQAGAAFGAGASWPVTDGSVLALRFYASYRVFRPEVVSAGGGSFGRWHEVRLDDDGHGGRAVTRTGSGALGRDGLSAEARGALDALGAART